MSCAASASGKQFQVVNDRRCVSRYDLVNDDLWGRHQVPPLARQLLGAIEVVCLFIGVKIVLQEPGFDGAGLFFATMDNDACSLLFRRVQKLSKLSAKVQPCDLPALTKACSFSRQCSNLRCNDVHSHHAKCQAIKDINANPCRADDEDTRRWLLTVHLAMSGMEQAAN